MNSADRKLIQEAMDGKPNYYIGQVILGAMVLIIGILLFNELNIFHVNKIDMRIGMLLSLLFVAIVRLFTASEKLKMHPKTKYVIMSCILVITLIMEIMLNFHATLALIFPIIASMQYPSRPLKNFAVAGAEVIAGFAPLISYVLGTWDTAFLAFILGIGGETPMEQSWLLQLPTTAELAKIFLYISLPHMLILLVLSMVARYTVRSSGESLRDYLKAMRMGGYDVLTGLMSRNSFEADTANFKADPGETLTAVYIDVNGLHEHNNRYGHEAGDEMLRSIAWNIKLQFGEESSYRIGGDEFTVLLKNKSIEELTEAAESLRERVMRNHYYISVGIAVKTFPCRIDELLKEAEKAMYLDKKAYYEAHPERNRRSSEGELPS